MDDALGLEQLHKLMGDGKTEVRRKGAQLVTNRTSQLFKDMPVEEAFATCEREMHNIKQHLIRSNAAAYRRSGTVAIRGVVGGIPSHQVPNAFLRCCAALILASFGDADPLVRIAAVEACHELVRRFCCQLLDVDLPLLFRALAVSIADGDQRVSLLGRETSATVREYIGGNCDFRLSLSAFVQCVLEMLTPFIGGVGSAMLDGSPVVQWTLEWMQYVLDLPEYVLIQQLPEYLGALLQLSNGCGGNDALHLLRTCQRRTADRFLQHHDMPLVPVLAILCTYLSGANTPDGRAFSLEWAGQLMSMDTQELLPFMNQVLGAVLPLLGALDGGTKTAACALNDQLVKLVLQTGQNCIDDSVPANASFTTALQCIGSVTAIESRIASLEWLLLLHHTNGAAVSEHIEPALDELMPLLFGTTEHVARKAVETVALLSGEERFGLLITHLLRMLHKQAPDFGSNSSRIIKQLQLHYQGAGLAHCEKFLLKLADRLSQETDKRFVSKVVLMLHALLLTSHEFMPVRDILREGVATERARSLFLGLYPCWRYNLVCALGLSFLGRAYVHARELLLYMGGSEVSVNSLVQLDRLVQLMESPVFSFLRMEMMVPSACIPLLQAQFAILMILPQSSPQHRSLHRRLKRLPDLVQLEHNASLLEQSSGDCVDYEALLADCRQAQHELSVWERCLSRDNMERRR